ncbi:putative receptor-like protein kinase At5g59700 [Bidens hawaiensis]|uniref:putative receptor-like protein kinase At5g59700 n=1 Tax=Bidens hawaiensis TaxID=980011 RepID=UPI00404A1BE2
MSELSSATDNFDEKWCIGEGGFGKVYKGKIFDSLTNTYAIKRMHFMADQGAPEFWVEVEMLSRVRHCNLVSLIGYCNEEKEMALVYEYVHNGTLYDHLHKKATLLTWSQWLKICIGAARGLDYLHTGTSTQDGIIHRDVKSSNILLDENYAAKIADFGLAKIGPINQTRTHVSTAVKGTFGYMDPNYFYTGRLTRKSDVYAFGVVLIEVLSGRPALDESLDEGLAIWAQDLIKQGKLSHIVRPSLRDHISKSSLKEFSCIAARCLISHPNQRPTMTEVLGSLDRALAYQERSTTSSQGRMGIKNVWSLFSLGRSGTSESKEINERTTIRGNVSIPVPSQEGENNRSDASNPTYDRGSNVVDPVEDDRVETYMPGVYVTISSSPDGTNKLKRVRFSRRNFDEQQAGTWWSENRKIVFERYNIHEPGPVG